MGIFYCSKYPSIVENTHINLPLSLTLSLSFNKINICKYIYVGPVVILWGPFGHTTTVTLPTHRTHLSFTRCVISLFNRFVTVDPKGRSFNVNLLFVAKTFEIFFTSLTFIVLYSKRKKKIRI